MKVLIAEDDLFIGEDLCFIVTNAGHEVVGPISDKSTFEQTLAIHKIDAAILDIRMEEEYLGLVFARLLHEKKIPFSFITSFADKETLKEAVATQPTGYLLKPFSKNEVLAEVRRLESIVGSQKILIKTTTGDRWLALECILYLKSNNNYVIICLQDSEILVRAKLGELLESLNHPHIIRMHQSYAINTAAIEFYHTEEVCLKNGDHFPVSRKYRSAFRDYCEEHDLFGRIDS